MASYLKASIQRSYAESFLTELERNDNQYFFFIAKSTQWDVDTNPPAYSDTVRSEYDVMNNIIAYKKLSPENIIFALPRYQWVSGTVYDKYDDNIKLFDETDPAIFYVVTDENKIYKCIDNANGAISTQKPTVVLPGAFSLGDGYKWQYLATVKESNLPYELTGYVPIEFASVASDGETQNQYNAQLQAVSSSITRMVVSNSSGASAGVYPYTVCSVTVSDNSPYVLKVGQFSTTADPTINYITITDTESVSRINTSSLSSYIGYTVRVDNSTTVNRQQINNYGIIVNAEAIGGNSVRFSVQDDVNPFVLTTATTVGQVASVEILPYINIEGNGEGAFAFPVMSVDKTITAIDVAAGGKNYSNVEVTVTSAKNAGTNHPVIRAVISPKGGHGSNILKELNVKDILIIIEITEEDSAKIISGGSYRQFGIIKNPLLTDGSLAGVTDLYYRDITLVRESGGIDTAPFNGSSVNTIIGSESYSAAKVVSVKSTTNNTITLKTLNSSGKFVSKIDRPDDYILSINTLPSPTFHTSEIIEQNIPAGTPFGSYSTGLGYDYKVSARVLSVSGYTLQIRLTSDSSFVLGREIVGTISGVTSNVSAVTPKNGEYVWIVKSDTNPNNGVLVNDGQGNQKLYKVNEVGNAYFDLDTTPAYNGLHRLELSTSVSSQVGAMDTTNAALTQNSFSSGDIVYQGSTGSYRQYATGQVYYWDFVNSARGNLYLTNVVGTFRSVSTTGITGSTLGAYIVNNFSTPEIDRTSGEILYIDNVRPIQRNMGQKEEFRLRLGF